MAKLTRTIPGFTRANNTLSRVVKDLPERRIDLEIGDSKEPDFKPQFKTAWFNNEYNRSIRAQEHPDAVVTTRGNQVRYETPDYTVIQYEKPEAGDEGGHELEWELPRKPESNILPFTLRYKGNVKFYHQPALTEKEIAEGAERPDNVIDSYAVYIDKSNHRVGGNNYATGKIEHIYRPKAIDAEGNEVWCKLNIPETGEQETNIECSVEVPQEFLDNAVYPVLVDPTFGYTTGGGTSLYVSGSLGDAFGHKSSVSIDGTLTSVSAYLRSTGAASNTQVYQVGNSDGYLGQYDVFRDVQADSLTASFAEYTSIAAGEAISGTLYVSIYGSYPEVTYLAYDSDTGTTGGFFSNGVSGNWSAQDTRNYSIYATYTASGGSETDTHTLDTLLKKTATSSHTVDTLLKETNTTSHSLDSLLKETATPGHSLSALVKATESTQHGIDAFLTVNNAQTHSVDALTKETSVPDHSLDGLLKETSSVSSSVDGYLLETVSLSPIIQDSTPGGGGVAGFAVASAYQIASSSAVFHTVDSVLKKQSSSSLSIDAIVKETNETGHTLDGVIADTLVATLIVHTSVPASGAVAGFAVASAYAQIPLTSHSVDGYVETTPPSHSIDGFLCHPWQPVPRNDSTWTPIPKSSSSWTPVDRVPSCK